MFINNKTLMAVLLVSSLYINNNVASQTSLEGVIVTDEAMIGVMVNNPDHKDLQVTFKVEEVDIEAPTTLEALAYLIETGKIKTQKQLLLALKHFPELKVELEKMIKKSVKTEVEIIRYVMIEATKVARDAILKLVKLIKNKQNLKTLIA